MSERKVLNKYYPPDYDPSKIPRARRPKNRQWNIRTMAPFNMRCNTCGEYIYKGKKFNSRQELAEGETYLGLKIFRFYIRCPKCVSEITFKTDPESVDYKLEAGATRNFEALRTAELMAQKEAKEKEEELENNPMKMLENRTKASQREMDMLETLEDLRELNSKHSKVDLDQEIEKYRKYEEKLRELQEEEDENFIQSVFNKNGGQAIKRLPDEDSDEDSEPGPSKPKIQKTENPTDVLTKDPLEPDIKNASATKKEAKNKSSQKASVLSKSSISMMIKKKSKPTDKSQTSKDISDTHKKVTIETVTKNPEPQSPRIPDERVTRDTVTKETESESVTAVTVTKETSQVIDSVNDKTQDSGLSLLGNYSDSESSYDEG